jgi:glucosamine-6-phosphate deaminase
MAINLMTTIKGSLLEDYFPQGWDLAKLDRIASRKPDAIGKPEKWWHKKFQPVSCATLEDFDIKLGHSIALEIAEAKKKKQQIAFILPVGPMGMYRWAVYFLTRMERGLQTRPRLQHGRMERRQGQHPPAQRPGAFQNAMEQAFYGPSANSPSRGQRRYATKKGAAQIRR